MLDGSGLPGLDEESLGQQYPDIQPSNYTPEQRTTYSTPIVSSIDVSCFINSLRFFKLNCSNQCLITFWTKL